jgi:hypothetical protein
MNHRLALTLLAGTGLLLTACSSLRVKVSGDSGVQYQAAWTTAGAGTTTRSGSVPATFHFSEAVTGWFQNAGGDGRFRVRVYDGLSLLVDETFENAGRRLVIEHQGRDVSYRIE